MLNCAMEQFFLNPFNELALNSLRPITGTSLTNNSETNRAIRDQNRSQTELRLEPGQGFSQKY